jgi:hypothetical protein
MFGVHYTRQIGGRNRLSFFHLTYYYGDGIKINYRRVAGPHCLLVPLHPKGLSGGMKLSSAGLAERVGQDNQGDRHAHEYQHDLAHITQCLQVFRIHKFLPHHLKIKTYLCICQMQVWFQLPSEGLNDEYEEHL